MAKNLSQLREQVRQKADIENDGQHISDSEVDAYINDSIRLLHSVLVDGTDGQLFAKNAGVLKSIGQYSFQLPSDFSQLVSVDVKVNSYYQRSAQADPQDYAALTEDIGCSYQQRAHFLRWSLEQGRGELFLFPEVTVASQVAVQYIPTAPNLSGDTDVLTWPDYWHQWVVFDAAVQCVNKSDNQAAANALSVERASTEKRIRDHIKSMTITRIKTIRKNTSGRYGRTNGRGFS